MRKLDDHQMRQLVRNVAIMDFVALPLAVLTLVISERFLPGPTEVSSFGDLLLPLLVALLPVSVGSILHQLLILRVSRRWSALGRRLAWIVSSPVTLSVLLLLVRLDYLIRLGPGVLVGLLTYSLLARPIPREETTT